jgi:hypothetical protein
LVDYRSQAFPLFSGFVSKSMIVAAGFEQHKMWVGFLLMLASAGTFLHTGLKVPYFIWFGKNKPRQEVLDRAAEPPWNMNAAMAIASVLCIFIGCYTPYLYRMLPFPVDYHPYTAYHVSETLQILLFTALGFFLLVKKLQPEALISLDMDWFYRKGGQAFLWLASKPIQLTDTFRWGVVPRRRARAPHAERACRCKVRQFHHRRCGRRAGGNCEKYRRPAEANATRPNAAEPGVGIRRRGCFDRGGRAVREPIGSMSFSRLQQLGFNHSDLQPAPGGGGCRGDQA